LRTVLGEDFGFFAAHFGIEENGNVPAQLDPQGELRGKNILAQRKSLAETARQFSLEPEQANERLLAALEKLRAVRPRRLRPHLDDKLLTANNALMISALAKAHQVLGDADYLAAATQAAGFVARELHDAARGILFRSWRDGRGATEGFAEDYAFLVQALLDLYEASFELRWLEWAVQLQAKMDVLFWDDAAGGYFNSSTGDASIVLRLKEDYDGAEPAPSSVAALNLLRLAALLHDAGRRERGVRCIEAFREHWEKNPQALPQLLCALELALEPPRHVVLVGNSSAAIRELAAVLHERLGPRRMILALTSDADRSWWRTRAPWTAEMKAVAGRPTAYVCEEFACRAPVNDAGALRSALA
jgi:uncharacterized protein YyaL (SSP411 family)